VSGVLVPLAQSSLVLAGIVVIMVRMDVRLMLVAAAMAPAFWACIRVFGRRIEQTSRAYHEHESTLLSTVQESLSSMRTVQAFTREPDTSLRFGAQALESFRINLALVRTQLLFSTSVGLALAVGTAAAVWLGASRVLAGQLSTGDVLVFLAYLGMLYQPLSVVSQSAATLQSCRAQLGRVFDVLDRSPEVVDAPGARPLEMVRGAIAFDRVSFGYDAGQPALRDVTLDIRPGEVVALVGPTGAGKSTLASLLLRFYDPGAGAVLLDGCDLRALPLAWLRQQVGVVLQEALLLSGTIRDNIAYGRPDATLQDIETAARRAQAHEFIAALPDGYDTRLAERAVNLSGGQKQRLAIARAFLKDAPILVLDEPTSAIDAETEEALIASLEGLAEGRTTIIIAHRLSTVRIADRILVLRQGSVIEQGSHDQLMDRDSLYRRLYRTQVGPAALRGASA
jgi:ABC-type multidrug transport system fused ATPase/permease subunit